MDSHNFAGPQFDELPVSTSNAHVMGQGGCGSRSKTRSMLVVLGKSKYFAQLGMVAHGTCSGFVVKPSDVESHLFCPSFQMFDGLFRVQVICPYLACPLTVPTSLHGLHINQQQGRCLGPWSRTFLPGPPPPEAQQLRGHSAVVVIISASLFRCACCPCDCASTAAKATPESISARYVGNDSAFVFWASGSNKMSAAFLRRLAFLPLGGL